MRRSGRTGWAAAALIGALASGTAMGCKRNVAPSAGDPPIAAGPVDAGSDAAAAPEAGATRQDSVTSLPPLSLSTGHHHEAASPASSVDAQVRSEVLSAAEKPDHAALVQLSDWLVEAIYTDPSAVWARYDLACLDNLLGTTQRATSSLRELEAAGCPTCQLALARLATDTACAWKPPMTDIGKGLRPLPLLGAAEAVAKALPGGKTAAIERLIPRSAKVEFTYVCSVCDRDHKPSVETLGGAAALALLGKLHTSVENGIEVSDHMVCDAACCEFPINGLMHRTRFLSKLCFSSSPKLALTRVEIIDG